MALHGSWPQGGVGGLQAGQFQVPHLVGAVGLPGGQCLCHDVVDGAPVTLQHGVAEAPVQGEQFGA